MTDTPTAPRPMWQRILAAAAIVAILVGMAWVTKRVLDEVAQSYGETLADDDEGEGDDGSGDNGDDEVLTGEGERATER